MKNVLLLLALFSITLLFSCGNDDAPPAENEEELIDLVTLTFTPTGGGSAIVVTATDPDGEGVAELTPDGNIDLASNTAYTLAITMENTEEGEDITAEIATEDDEHMIFFSFTTDIFSNPAGDGNVDNRADALNYSDQDDNGYGVGLSTAWTTGNASTAGSFRIVLKHQPDIKSATSTSADGGTDVDITWTINISDPS